MLEDESIYCYGSENPAELLDSFYRTGTELLIKIKTQIASQADKKCFKVWNTTQAAELVGVSRPTFRKIIEKHETMPGIITEVGKRQGLENKKFTLEAINLIREIAGTRYIRPFGSKTLILCIANLKGGVTKTETALSLAQKSATLGLRVLLIDNDPQATSTAKLGRMIPDMELVYEDTIVEALLEDPRKIYNIIRKTHYDGLDLLPANLVTQDCDTILPDPNRNNAERLGDPYWRLKKVLDLIKDKYDLILLDCGPNTGYLNLNAMCITNGIIIPVPPNTTDFSSFLTFASTLRTFFSRLKGKKLEYLRILLAKHEGTNDALQMERVMRKLFREYILQNHMCHTVEVAKAASEIGSIYDITKPTGNKNSYNRAIKHLDDVNMEMITQFKDIWNRQAKASNLENVSQEEAING